jgi:hypothetical protein
MKFYQVERIKKMIGLPSEAGNRDIEARLAELLEKEEELETLKNQAPPPKKKGWQWWK